MASVRAVVLPVAAAVGLAAGTAVHAEAVPDDTRAVVVGGQAANGAMLGGHFTPTRIDVTPAGQLVATGTLDAALTGPPGSTQVRAIEAVTLPVDRGASVGNCRMLDLYIGSGDVTVNRLPVHVDRTDLNVTFAKGPGSRLMMPLCAVADLLPSDDTVGLRNALNQVLDLMGSQPAVGA